MTRLPIHDSLLKFILDFVLVQGVIVGLLGIATIGLLHWRNWHKKNSDLLKSIYSSYLVDELLDFMSGSPEVHLKKSFLNTGLKREAAKIAHLDQIQSVSGLERDYLISRYKELGFAEQDFSMCRSSTWWKRLKGICTLSLVATEEFAFVFDRLRSDENDLVAAHALHALSALDCSLNVMRIEDLRRLSRCGRNSLLMAVACNWCKTFGFSKVLSFSSTVLDAEIRFALLKAVLTIKTPEVSDEFIKILDKSDDLPPEMLSVILQALVDIGDPQASTSVQKYLSHPHELVRQRALEFCLLVAVDLTPFMATLQADSSANVRRLLMAYAQQEAA